MEINESDYIDANFINILDEISSEKSIDDNNFQYFSNKILEHFNDQGNNPKVIYSDINFYISEQYKDNGNKGGIEYINKNIKSMLDCIEDVNDVQYSENEIRLRIIFLKVLDNIALFEQNATIQQNLEEAIRVTEQIKDQNNNLKNNYDIIKSKQDKQMIDIITVLSIFSGVIMSLSGGFSYIGNAMTNIGEADFEIIVITLCFGGLVVFNILYSLFWMIGKVSSYSLTFCIEDDCTNCEEKDCKKSTVKRLLKKHKPFCCVNIVLIITIIISFLKSS